MKRFDFTFDSKESHLMQGYVSVDGERILEFKYMHSVQSVIRVLNTKNKLKISSHNEIRRFLDHIFKSLQENVYIWAYN